MGNSRSKRTEGKTEAIPVLRSFEHWRQLVDTLSERSAVAFDAAANFERENPVKPKSLLDIPRESFTSEIADRPAERDARRRSAQADALRKHLEQCLQLPVVVALLAQPAFQNAKTLVLGEGQTDPERYFAFLASIATPASRWAVLRWATSHGKAIRLRLPKREMREAAELADKLRGALGDVINCGSDTGDSLFVRARSGDAFGGEALSLRGILAATAKELRRSASQPERTPRNDSTAVDRALLAELEACMQASFGPQTSRVFELLATALGIELDRRNVERALSTT